MLKLLCMSKSIKQIYVAVELCENEIRILAAEYFNTRFNIIRSDRYETKAISDFRITDKNAMIQDLKRAFAQSSNKIGSDIEQAILVVPAYNFKRFPLKSKIVLDNKVLDKNDIARAVTNSLQATVDSDVIVVNANVTKYLVNGITSRRMPENEVSDEAVIDVDLLCADRDMCYDYVSAVEECGVKVLDIVLNNYAIAKEASLFEESLSKNIIILDVHRTCTYLTLLAKGRLASTEVIFEGLNLMTDNLYRRYYMPYADILRPVKYVADFDTRYPEDAVYAWTDQNNTNVLTYRQLNEAIEAPLNSFCDKLAKMCEPIIEAGAKIILTGEGQQTKCLKERLQTMCNCEISEYFPDTIGIRDASMTALYGAFIVYREKAVMNDLSVSCIDLLKYDELINLKQLDSEGDTITTKIKNLFKHYIEKGGI